MRWGEILKTRENELKISEVFQKKKDVKMRKRKKKKGKKSRKSNVFDGLVGINRSVSGIGRSFRERWAVMQTGASFNRWNRVFAQLGHRIAEKLHGKTGNCHWTHAGISLRHCWQFRWFSFCYQTKLRYRALCTRFMVEYQFCNWRAYEKTVIHTFRVCPSPKFDVAC